MLSLLLPVLGLSKTKVSYAGISKVSLILHCETVSQKPFYVHNSMILKIKLDFTQSYKNREINVGPSITPHHQQGAEKLLGMSLSLSKRVKNNPLNPAKLWIATPLCGSR